MSWLKEHLLSRKFALALISLGLILIGYLVTHWWIGLANQFPTYVGAVLGSQTIYSGGNVIDSHLSNIANSLPKGPGLTQDKSIGARSSKQAQDKDDASNAS